MVYNSGFFKEDSFYSTEMGEAHAGDSLELMKHIPDDSIDLIFTSPPFALLRKKEYGNVESKNYIDWFLDFAKEFKRIIKPEGSLVIDIGGTWIKGSPTRSLYHFELVLQLCKPEEEGGLGLHLAQELFWYNPSKLPTPAQWVTIERIRVKDAVNTVWWLSKSKRPNASNRKVLKPYSESQKRLIKNGYKAKKRPSGHKISEKFGTDNKGAIPPNIIDGREEEDGKMGDPVPVNLISSANTSSNDIYQRMCKKHGVKAHPARFPSALPEFIVKLCTEEGDLVLDPFAGSNTTGFVAEKIKRNWIAIEISEEYLNASKFRFPGLLDDF